MCVLIASFSFLTEFPAVLLNIVTGQIEDEFHQFVRPTKRPKLSDYCRQLTGISQKRIGLAKKFPVVFREFSLWLDEIVARKQLVFYTKDNSKRAVGQNAICCSWSSWDLRHYFQLETRNHGIRWPTRMKVWIDFQIEFQVFSLHLSRFKCI